LVGEREQARRNFDAKCPRSLKIDQQFELGWLHHRQVSRLLALEDASGIDASLTVSVGYAGSVAHEAAGRDELAQREDRGKAVRGAQDRELLAMRVHERAGTNQQRAGSAVGECCKGCLEFALAADI